MPITVASVLSDFATLTPTEQNTVRSRLLHPVFTAGRTLHEFVEEERFADGRVCPHCGCSHVVRNGRRPDGVQRFLCKDCGKSFVVTTNSITERTKKSLDQWEKYVECMLNGFSLRQCASQCNISLPTAFYWRHRILDALQAMAGSVLLDGIVEADETFLDISYKGNHSRSSWVMPRKPHKRGGSSRKRGLSSDKVCIPCAVDRNGLSVARIANLARIKTKGLKKALSANIKDGCTIISDKAAAYKPFSREKGMTLVQLKAGKASCKGIYNLQHINNYHSQLKKFMKRFDGVSTKHLNNYLVWHNFVNYSREEYAEKKKILLNYVLGTKKSVRNNAISSRKVLPVLA